MPSQDAAVPDTSNLTQEEAASRASMLTVDSYRVELDLTTGPDTFSSVTTVRFTSSAPGTSTFIDLMAPRVGSVTLNGTPLDDVYDGSARISLPGLAADNELVVEADCAYMHTGEGLHSFVDPVDGETYLYSQFEVADCRRMFAVFDQPDLKSRFTLRVKAPQHWRVISTMPTPTPEVADGAGVWEFAATPTLSPYITSLIAGPYEGVTSELTSSDGTVIPLGVFCRRSLVEHLDAEEILDVTRAGFAFFEKTFGCPYPFPKYDQIMVPEFNAGAMENAGAVTFLESYVFRGKVTEALRERRAQTVLHELAHMWFGDLVTMRWWNDLWLNESFAEYQCTVALAERTRWSGVWSTFAAQHKTWAYRQDQLPSTHPVVAPMRDLAEVEVNFDGITYAKGASVLKQLVAWVGREHFEEGVRQYFAKHAWGNTTLPDFLRELEATSGRDLSEWSRLWLESAGVTLLSPVIETADGSITSLKVAQTAPESHPLLRPHRLAIGGYDLTDGVLRRSWRVELDVDGELTEVTQAQGKPLPDLLLLNDDDLAYARIRLDPTSMATAVEHLGGFEESLPRSLIWAAAWDMVRDAELRVKDYAQLVTRNISRETDSSVRQTVVRQLTAGVLGYLAGEDRMGLAGELSDRFRGLAMAASAGSDEQLQFVRAAAGYAVSPETRTWLQGLLAGSASLPGLTVDTDLRWELVTALASTAPATQARAMQDLIAATAAIDQTATGQQHAAAARAAVATPEVKRETWQQLMTDDELPNAMQSALIRGWSMVTDPSLLAEFVEPYFAGVAGIWERRTNEMAQQVVIGLYPHANASETVVRLTQEWLDTHPDANPGLRRLMSENGDGARRAVVNQTFNRAALNR